jgi:cysteine desulfuration protein SufE
MTNSIKEKQRELIEEFREINDWRERYRAIIEYGEELGSLPEEFRQDYYLIKECQNRAWLGACFREGKVVYYADAESQIVKGLAAMLIELYSNHTTSEILNTPAEFIPELQLGENLTRNRTNGLGALVSRIKRIALGFELEEQQAKVPK